MYKYMANPSAKQLAHRARFAEQSRERARAKKLLGSDAAPLKTVKPDDTGGYRLRKKI